MKAELDISQNIFYWDGKFRVIKSDETPQSS